VILVLSALIRLFLATRHEFWLDEACTALYSSYPLDHFFHVLRTENHPPLYYLLTSLLNSLFGHSESLYRLPSVLASLYALYVVWDIDDRRIGGAVLILAFSPFFLSYSVQARQYALLVMFIFMAIRAFRRREPVALALISAVAMFTHYMFLFFIVPYVTVHIVLGKRDQWKTTVVAILAGLLPWVLWFGFFANQRLGVGTAWVKNYFINPAILPFKSLMLFGPSPQFPTYLGHLGAVRLPGPFAWVNMAVVIFGCLLIPASSFVRYRSRHSKPNPGTIPPGQLSAGILSRPWREFMVVLAIFAELLIVSFIISPVYLVGRYDIIALPGFILAISGAARAMGGFWKRILPVLYVLPAVVFISAYSLQPAYVPVSTMVDDMRSVETDHTAVFAIELTWAVTAFQDEMRGNVLKPVAFPPDVSRHPGWFNVTQYNTPQSRRKLNLWVTGLPQKLADKQQVMVAGRLDPSGVPAYFHLSMLLIKGIQKAGFHPVRKKRYGEYYLFVFKR